MAKKNTRSFLPAILVFIVLNTSFLVFKEKWDQWGFNSSLLLGGNILIFVITAASYFMNRNGLLTKNNHAFFRMVYGSFIIKFFVLVGAVVIYMMAVTKDVNKPALFFCMGLYLVYLFLEVSALMKLSKENKNAKEGSTN